MLLIPEFFYSRNVFFLSLKIPKIPENYWISGGVEALYQVHLLLNLSEKKCCVKLCLDQKFITAKSIRASGVARIFLIGGMGALLLLFFMGVHTFSLCPFCFTLSMILWGGGGGAPSAREGTQICGGHMTPRGGARHSAPPPPIATPLIRIMWKMLFHVEIQRRLHSLHLQHVVRICTKVHQAEFHSLYTIVHLSKKLSHNNSLIWANQSLYPAQICQACYKFASSLQQISY